MKLDASILSTLSADEVKQIRRLSDRGVTIPSQPRVLLELEQQLARGVKDVRAIAKTISQDPGLVAMLFKIVQSSAYRQYHPFEGLDQIIQAIGLGQTANLVRVIALTTAMPAKHNQKAFEAYWARSKAISELAMLVADERVMVCNIFPDQACLAGVFHECGIPVLMQRFSTYCQDLMLDRPGHWASLQEEDARFNADHCVVGYLVAKHWKLPAFICDAIRFHHEVSRIDDHEGRTMVAILQLAIHLYNKVMHHDDPEWFEHQSVVLEELGLGEDSLQEFMDIVIDRYHHCGA